MSFLTKLFSRKKTETKFPNVIVGRIMTIEDHPNADRLRCVVVDTGEKLRIVCGAPNLEIGQYVPVALIGATLPNGMAIQQASIRGVESEGMLCAADELGLGDDHGGILALREARVGDPIDAYISF